jgi:hypothetical protein
MMLRDGKHIKEPPPQIGKYWVPQMWNGDKTYEEQFMQEVLLGYDATDLAPWKQILARLLRI